MYNTYSEGLRNVEVLQKDIIKLGPLHTVCFWYPLYLIPALDVTMYTGFSKQMSGCGWNIFNHRINPADHFKNTLCFKGGILSKQPQPGRVLLLDVIPL